MDSLNEAIKTYTEELRGSSLQRAYKAIISTMTALSRFMKEHNPDFAIGALYQGYMDMTYFPVIPPGYREKGLKIAVVYLHSEGRFEAWLSGVNKSIQRDYAKKLAQMQKPGITVQQSGLGVDSIVETILEESPDFNDLDSLMEKLEDGTKQFIHTLDPLFD